NTFADPSNEKMWIGANRTPVPVAETMRDSPELVHGGRLGRDARTHLLPPILNGDRVVVGREKLVDLLEQWPSSPRRNRTQDRFAQHLDSAFCSPPSGPLSSCLARQHEVGRDSALDDVVFEVGVHHRRRPDILAPLPTVASCELSHAWSGDRPGGP